MQGMEPQRTFFFTVEIGVMCCKVVMGSKEKATRSTGRITDRLAWLWSHRLHNSLNQGSWGEILPGSCFGILGILLQQPFIGVSFDISVQDHPLFTVNEVCDQPTKLCWV